MLIGFSVQMFSWYFLLTELFASSIHSRLSSSLQLYISNHSALKVDQISTSTKWLPAQCSSKQLGGLQSQLWSQLFSKLKVTKWPCLLNYLAKLLNIPH